MTISNMNANVGNVDFWGADKVGNVVAHFYPFRIDEDGNAQQAIYTYVDSDVTISGYVETRRMISEYDEDKNANIWYEWKVTIIYSIKWEKGWNVWNYSSSSSLEDRTITEQWTTIPVSELKWYGDLDLWK